ncbi:4-hydroxythreonine-4-phosphate dehydrogenase PdxA [candidate division WOR-3 bacterium]|nr:4-hydroxythreonine-4-phosphate dehydrogenase PdxA [candidate division WOR-3 bacterium]
MKIGITIGDPAGIGPELVLRSLPRLKGIAEYSIFGNSEVLKKTARDLHLLRNYSAIKSSVMEVTEDVRFEYGKSTKVTACVALQSMQSALESGVDIIITAPIVKATMRSVIPGFIGHTEYFARFFSIHDYGMTGIWKDKRIMLLTTHLPLRHVFRKLHASTISEKIVFFERGLRRYFGIENPRIAVSAVNPHSFEFSMGEDEEIKQGVLQAARKGIQVSGPFPADTLFGRHFDGFVAIYHDQAMVFLKSKKDGLNFTLGLPIIRLSPLCGAALDIAGKGCAEVSGFMAAIRVGKRLYNNLRRYEKKMCSN